MDVVGHEAVGQDARAGVREILVNQTQVKGPVSFGKENPLVIGTPLSNMIGSPGATTLALRGTK